MIIDFHAHIFPKEIRENREKFFSSEPAFGLLYRSPEARLAGAGDVVASMDAHRVDVSVIFGFPWKNPDIFKKHNDYIFEAVAKHPARLVGFCCFDPSSKEAASEAVRCLEGGFSGVGEIAFYQDGIGEASLEQLGPIMDICREKNLPVLIHTNEPIGHVYPGKTAMTLREIFGLVERFPKNQIVLAHWGGGIFFFSLLKRGVKESLKNVYFDTAASPFLYDAAVYRTATQIVGSNKILFGSDFPLLKPGRCLEEMACAGLAAEDMENICGRNAAKLLGLF